MQSSVKACSWSTGLFGSIMTTDRLLIAQQPRTPAGRYCFRTFPHDQTPRIYARKRPRCRIYLTAGMVSVYTDVRKGRRNKPLLGILERECDVDHLSVFTIVNLVFTIVNLTFTKVSNHLPNRPRLVAPALLSLEASARVGQQDRSFDSDELAALAPSLGGASCWSFTNVCLLSALRLELDLLRYSAPLEMSDIVSRYQEMAIWRVVITSWPNAQCIHQTIPQVSSHVITRRVYVNT